MKTEYLYVRTFARIYHYLFINILPEDVCTLLYQTLSEPPVIDKKKEDETKFKAFFRIKIENKSICCLLFVCWKLRTNSIVTIIIVQHVRKNVRRSHCVTKAAT